MSNPYYPVYLKLLFGYDHLHHAGINGYWYSILFSLLHATWRSVRL